MAITGIYQIVYGVAELEAGMQFHTEFGLPLTSRDATSAAFHLEDGSSVMLRLSSDPLLPAPYNMVGDTVREVCWGVDSLESLQSLAENLRMDRDVVAQPDGGVRFLDDVGLPTRLCVWNPKPVVSNPDLTNAPGRIERWNRNRTWHERAVPKQMQHIVFCHPEPRMAARFYVNRLGFRISDMQDSGGYFLRAEGRPEHHHIYWQVGKELAFRHVAYGLQSIDELMAGAAHMRRLGHESAMGLGRHRISSTFFYYLSNPCGGDSEYSTDTDCLDDDWIPRVWSRAFGHVWWLAKPRASEPEMAVRKSTPEERIL